MSTSSNTRDLTIEEIESFKSVLNLISQFFNKILIQKGKFNEQRYLRKLEKVKEYLSEDKKKAKKRFLKIIESLNSKLKRERLPKIFYLIGAHGGIIVNDIGFCEFDSPPFALQKLNEKLEFALKNEAPFNLEIAVSCLEWLRAHYPDQFSRFLSLFKQGDFEFINSTYTQPYCLTISEESNLKQFELGIETLNQLGLESNIYYASESSVHPQLPQILSKFGIEFASLRTRLLGINPSTPYGNIDWIGLDGTKIQSIINQSGVFNGEYWHGAFFQELPQLLYQALSFWHVNYIVYSCLEDFIMEMPYQEEVWQVSKYSDILGKFTLCSDFLTLTEKAGEFQFSRDEFYLGKNIFLPKDLFLNNKHAENLLLDTESINALALLFGFNSEEEKIQKLWKKLLLTQAHDNYAVPFVRNGDYSLQQLSRKEYDRLEFSENKISISDLSLEILKEVQENCKNIIHKCISKLAKSLNKNDEATKTSKSQEKIEIMGLNSSNLSRMDFISLPLKYTSHNDWTLKDSNGTELAFDYTNSEIKFIADIPSFGYEFFELSKVPPKKREKVIKNYLYSVEISKTEKEIKISHKGKNVFSLGFASEKQYKLKIDNISIGDVVKEVKIKAIDYKNNSQETFSLKLLQYNGINRLEFQLNSFSLNGIVIKPSFQFTQTFINYPFGIEETKRCSVQSLDFLWARGSKRGIIFMQKNSQQFEINRHKNEIVNLLTTDGRYEFCVSIVDSEDYYEGYRYSKSYLNSFYGYKVDINSSNQAKKRKSFLSINKPLIISNFWRRGKNLYIRVYNPTKNAVDCHMTGPFIGNMFLELNFNYSKLKEVINGKCKIKPWEIKLFKIIINSA
jgi:hypothetical protein